MFQSLFQFIRYLLDYFDPPQEAVKSAAKPLSAPAGLTSESGMKLSKENKSTGSEEKKAGELTLIGPTEEEKRAEAAREKVVATLRELFPDTAYVEDGFWPWANTRLDIVFFGIELLEPLSKKWFTGEIVIHSMRPHREKELEMTDLVMRAKAADVSLLLLKDGDAPDADEMLRRLEAIFQNQFRIHSAILPSSAA